MVLRILYLFLLCVNVLSAGLEDYLKKATDKLDIHHIRNVDYIYLINLDERTEKYSICMDQLDPYNIFPYRFSAVNGWKLDLETINAIGVPFKTWMQNDLWGTSFLIEDAGKPLHELMHVPERSYFYHGMTLGAIGICLSHLSILQDAFDSGYETIWVMEDDIQVIQNPNLISDYIEKLDYLVGPENWDILFTDQDTKDQKGEYVICLSYAPRPNYQPQDKDRFAVRTIINNDFKKIGARYGAYSMILRRSGIIKILDFIKKYHVFLPYDMDFYLPENINLYALCHDVVSTIPNAPSDNSQPNFQNKKNSKSN